MNPGAFDRRRLQFSFGRAAPVYAQAAVLQREVEARLLEQLDYLEEKQPARILDVGSGPGRASGAMKKRWPKADVIALDLALPMLRQVPKHTRFWRPVRRVCADASQLPFADASVDVIFSSLCLQWVAHLPRALDEFRRVLREDGLLLFATFGPDTLVELREAYLAGGEQDPPLSSFAAIQQVGDALMAAGFRNPVIDRDHYTLTYPDVRSLQQELRAIGAGDARATRPRGLGGKQRQSRMREAYEAQRRDGVLPSTWEVIGAMAWAPGPGAPRREDGAEIASFPADRIPLRRR
ncbi:malonyl-ACP O-methyltransferase BioC [Arenimonas sp.]|uniref:malonyl-ACP O-methyltransferase BioC n=1 Tax=Arenimonas sp. TaxID=1872635 RepID=UPI0039E28392